MRFVPVLVAAAMVGGCAPPEIQMSHMSTLQSTTNGVVLHDNGQRGHAAMRGTTCEFDTLNGWIVEDHDLPTRSEDIQDALDGAVLGTSPKGVHFVHSRLDDELVAGVVASRLLGGVTATIRVDEDGTCIGTFGPVTVELPAAACDPESDVAVDRVAEALIIATGGDVLAVDANGFTVIDGGANLVVFDAVAERIYLARKGEREVWAIELDGSIAWTVELNGPVHAMSDMGIRGKIVAMIGEEGRGTLVVMQGEDGLQVSEHPTPAPTDELTVSEDGTTLGVVLEAEVYFYDVIEEGEEPKKRETFGSDPAPQFFD